MNNLKKIAFALMSICLIAIPAFSQTPAVQQMTKQAQPVKQAVKQAKPAKQLKQKPAMFPSQKLVDSLQLTPTQVKSIQTERQKEVAPLLEEAKTATPEKRKEIMTQVKAISQKVISSKLTPEQKAKFDKIQEMKMQKKATKAKAKAKAKASMPQ